MKKSKLHSVLEWETCDPKLLGMIIRGILSIISRIVRLEMVKMQVMAMMVIMRSDISRILGPTLGV